MFITQAAHILKTDSVWSWLNFWSLVSVLIKLVDRGIFLNAINIQKFCCLQNEVEVEKGVEIANQLLASWQTICQTWGYFRHKTIMENQFLDGINWIHQMWETSNNITRLHQKIEVIKEWPSTGKLWNAIRNNAQFGYFPGYKWGSNNW